MFVNRGLLDSYWLKTLITTFKRFIPSDCGLKFIDTVDLCTDDIHKILWACLDLKTRAKTQKTLGKPLKNKKLTMLCEQQASCINLIVQSSVKTLGADLQVMVAPKWERSRFKRDVGRFYSLFSDMILAQGRNHMSVCELLRGAAPVPVINICSHKFVPLHGLGLLMTLQEHFGRLAGLTVAWVGPMGNKLNTLIYLLPKVGINLRYNSSPRPEYPVSPLVKPVGMSYCRTYHTKIEEFPSPEETINGADVIGTSKHREETVKIEIKMFDEARDGWVFLHFLPRWEGDVCQEVFNHKNSLVWKLHENIQYSIMAVVLDTLKGYHPIIAKPNFG